MGKTAVLAEKPSVARDIARVLGCSRQGAGFIESGEHIVTWAVGHLAVLFEPEDYNPDLKRWRIADLPIMPELMKIKPARETSEQFEIIKSIINSDEVDSIVCATDSGREGELIFRYIYALAGCSKPFRRLWISSMTDEAIKAGFASLRDGREYDSLFLSAKCRSEADWLVGINASRAFSIMCGTNLSIGRVQTPTLAMIVAKQKEIDAFDSKSYYEAVAQYDSFSGTWFCEKDGGRDTRIVSKADAEKIVSSVKRKNAFVSELEEEEKQAPPPLLYDLTELQRDANKKYGYSADRTLSLVQDLYEKRKAVTYPRTDSRYLSSDMEKLLPYILKRIAFGPYLVFIKDLLSDPAGIRISKRIIDNSKITDHHAIIPVNGNISPSGWSDYEKNVFDLIARRFVSVFMPYNIYTLTRAVIECEGERFLSKGKTVRQAGWTEIYDDLKLSSSRKQKKKDDDEQALPPLSVGDCINIMDAKAVAKKTKPPAQYTEASLLSAMEHAGRFVEDEALREQLKEGGLGTPATRAGIIERLISVGYMKRSGKSLVPTEKGIKLIEIVPPEMRSPETTGKWEKALSSIYKGSMDSGRFMESIRRYVRFLVKEAEKAGKKADFGLREHNESSLGACPACGHGDILENSRSFFCSSWQRGCRFSFAKGAFLKKYGFMLGADDVRSLLSSGEHERPEGTVMFKSSEGLKFIPKARG